MLAVILMALAVICGAQVGIDTVLVYVAIAAALAAAAFLARIVADELDYRAPAPGSVGSLHWCVWSCLAVGLMMASPTTLIAGLALALVRSS